MAGEQWSRGAANASEPWGADGPEEHFGKTDRSADRTDLAVYVDLEAWQQILVDEVCEGVSADGRPVTAATIHFRGAVYHLRHDIHAPLINGRRYGYFVRTTFETRPAHKPRPETLRLRTPRGVRRTDPSAKWLLAAVGFIAVLALFGLEPRGRVVTSAPPSFPLADHARQQGSGGERLHSIGARKTGSCPPTVQPEASRPSPTPPTHSSGPRASTQTTEMASLSAHATSSDSLLIALPPGFGAWVELPMPKKAHTNRQSATLDTAIPDSGAHGTTRLSSSVPIKRHGAISLGVPSKDRRQAAKRPNPALDLSSDLGPR
jgi:hypothetical protein